MVIESNKSGSSSEEEDNVEVEIEQEENQSHTYSNQIQINDQPLDEEVEEVKQSEKEDIAQKFSIGENVDCLDTVNKWLNAEVVAIRGNQIRVHYSGWSAKFDEWFDFNSPRVLKQWRRGQNLRINNRIDVFHQVTKQWLEAIVIETNGTNNCIKVHYVGYHSRHDEQVVDFTDLKRVDEVGVHSAAFGIGRRRRDRNIATLRALFQKRENDFAQLLRAQKGLLVHVVGGDGNCLFRAASDQMYGTEDFHDKIRTACLDYIESEKVFFEAYIDEDFEDYIVRKRQNGEWGDDIELQALSEIYNRPIEIYAYSATPMRTFHETNQSQAQPIVLSFHGSCHYNSLRKLEKLNQVTKNYQGYLLSNEFGKLETAALQSSQSRKSNNIQVSNVELNDAIEYSRKEFETLGKRDMESAMEESLRSFEEGEKNRNEQQVVDIAIKTSIDAFMEDQEDKLIVEQLRNETRNNQEPEIIDNSFQNAQLNQIEHDELAQALQQSKAEAMQSQNNSQQQFNLENNPTIAAVVATGLPFDLAVQGYSVFGDFPDLIINYIIENYS